MGMIRNLSTFDGAPLGSPDRSRGGAIRRVGCFVVAALPLAAAPGVAGEATDLFTLYAETAPGGAYGGSGWMTAPRGLDASGPVLSIEVGRSLGDAWGGSALGGWRLSSGRVIATALGGVEIGRSVRPKASADLWWDDAGWMATARAQATPAAAAWRVATGWKPMESLPWLGPELSSVGDGLRIGAHATGVGLPGGFEARTSAGWSAEGGYAEISLWRRF